MENIVIVAGGNCDLSLYRDILNDAYIIGADRGALYLAEAGYKIDIAVGDFDSVTQSETELIFKNASEIDRLDCEKDETDLEHALNRALRLTGTIHILGGTGSRLDQTVSAINLLKACQEHNREAFIYDSKNRIRLIEGKATLTRDDRYKYVSLIPYGDVMVNVSLKGFKYSGDHIRLERRSTLGISNEIVDDEAHIRCRGYLFVFESRD